MFIYNSVTEKMLPGCILHFETFKGRKLKGQYKFVDCRRNKKYQWLNRLIRKPIVHFRTLQELALCIFIRPQKIIPAIHLPCRQVLQKLNELQGLFGRHFLLEHLFGFHDVDYWLAVQLTDPWNFVR